MLDKSLAIVMQIKFVDQLIDFHPHLVIHFSTRQIGNDIDQNSLFLLLKIAVSTADSDDLFQLLYAHPAITRESIKSMLFHFLPVGFINHRRHPLKAQ